MRREVGHLKYTTEFIDQSLINRSIRRVGTAKTSKSRIEWECLICAHHWFTSPENIIRNNNGCSKCVYNRKRLYYTDELISQELKLRNLDFTFSTIHDKPASSKVWWTCSKGHKTSRSISEMLRYQQGCKQCHSEQSKTFVRLSILDLPTTRQIQALNYNEGTKALEKLKWKCLICSTAWTAHITGVIYHGSGCIKCAKKSYSPKSIRWLQSISSNIQHALNGGEAVLPNIKFRADGYDPLTNTVYEFLGDYWHGNPARFPTNKQHPQLTKKTFGQLYEKTLNRLKQLEQAGYNVVYIWERDWDAKEKANKKEAKQSAKARGVCRKRHIHKT